MKTILALLALCYLLVAKSYAAENGIWYVAKTSVVSEYLGGIGSIFYTQPLSVTEFDMGRGDWYGGLWTSIGLGGTPYGTTYGDEIDVYAGWVHTFGAVKLDVSSSYYTVANLDRVDDDLWVIEPEISLPTFPFVQPYVRGRYFGQVGSQSARPGFFWFAGLRKNIILGKGMAERSYTLNLTTSTAYAAGALHDSTGFVYGRLTTSLDAPLSRHWTLSPSVIYQVAAPGQRSDPHGFTDGNKLVFGLTIEGHW